MPVKAPIIDAIVEVVFESSLPSQALVGILYQNFSDDFHSIENLPMLQVPEEIRKQNPDLARQPNYRINGHDFTLSLGEGVMYIGCYIDRREKFYPGWDKFGSFANKVTSYCIEDGIFGSVSKVGVRYINFFEESGLFDKTKIDLKVAGSTIVDPKSNIYFEHNEDNKNLKVQLAGEANVNSPNLGSLKGAVMDISSSKEGQIEKSEVASLIDSLHTFVEDHFFDIMKPDALPEGVEKRVG
ncbi:MAG: hypothetical protein JWO41_224 [Candidatus Saccharibacteria bacterium]|nr:hypothetical protein [Candidatus Saccharibacteria bacterium]